MALLPDRTTLRFYGLGLCIWGSGFLAGFTTVLQPVPGLVGISLGLVCLLGWRLWRRPRNRPSVDDIEAQLRAEVHEVIQRQRRRLDLAPRDLPDE